LTGFITSPEGSNRLKRQTSLIHLSAFPLLAVGLFFIALSIYTGLSSFAIIGTSLLFWSSLLLYIRPSRLIPITYLTASTATAMSNIERLLTQLQVIQKGIYLPPKNLQDIESSLVYIPKMHKQDLPQNRVPQALIICEENKGLLLTPPGAALIKLYEETAGTSFIKTDFAYVQAKIPELLTEDLEMAENVEIEKQNDRIFIDIAGNIFQDDCRASQKFPQAHYAVGCLLSSSLACVLAKVIGKPVTIESEEHQQEKKRTRIEYRVMEKA
jgi:hypothetical protein